MKLEDEIAQKKFKSEYQKAAINITHTYNWMSKLIDDYFVENDLTPQQYNVMRILRGQHPKTSNLKLIKERMLDRMSDVSRIIDKLYQKGYVMRVQSLSDRRNVDLTITDKGLKTLKNLDFIDNEFKKILSNLNEKEIVQLNNLLDKLRG